MIGTLRVSGIKAMQADGHEWVVGKCRSDLHPFADSLMYNAAKQGSTGDMDMDVCTVRGCYGCGCGGGVLVVRESRTCSAVLCCGAGLCWAVLHRTTLYSGGAVAGLGQGTQLRFLQGPAVSQTDQVILAKVRLP